MLATRIFVRPGTHIRNFHYSVPSHIEAWTESPQNQEINKLIDVAENTPSTNRASTPAVQQPYQIFESWQPNTFYSPLDFLRSRRIIANRPFSVPPSVGPGAREALYNDAFRQLNIDPVSEANNPALLRNFVTKMGKIRPRAQTGLSWRSQRMVARAIKRARQKGVFGIMSGAAPGYLA